MLRHATAVATCARDEAYLLGSVDFEACLALQQRLVYEAAGRDDGQITLLLCEHPLTITVGRQGSRADIRLGQSASWKAGGSRSRWVNRGGGCLVHAPGQLAIYPIVPLEPHGFTWASTSRGCKPACSRPWPMCGFTGAPSPAAAASGAAPDKWRPSAWP